MDMEAPGLIPSLIGAPLAGAGGVAVGVVEDLVFDEATNRPLWLLVRLAAGGFTFVPAGRLSSRARAVRVPFEADAILATPVRLSDPAAVSREHAVRLCRHYGIRLPAATWSASVGRVHGSPAPAAVAAGATLAEAS
jgi:hypothetical protein